MNLKEKDYRKTVKSLHKIIISIEKKLNKVSQITGWDSYVDMIRFREKTQVELERIKKELEGINNIKKNIQ